MPIAAVTSFIRQLSVIFVGLSPENAHTFSILFASALLRTVSMAPSPVDSCLNSWKLNMPRSPNVPTCRPFQ